MSIMTHSPVFVSSVYNICLVTPMGFKPMTFRTGI